VVPPQLGAREFVSRPCPAVEALLNGRPPSVISVRVAAAASARPRVNLPRYAVPGGYALHRAGISRKRVQVRCRRVVRAAILPAEVKRTPPRSE